MTIGHSYGLEEGEKQQVEVEVSPTVTKSIHGISELDRKKYFNWATAPAEINNRFANDPRIKTYLEAYEMTTGRSLSGVYGETRWGGGYQEDPQREGFMDRDYFIEQKKGNHGPNDTGLGYYKSLWGANANVAQHDRTSRHDAYPSWMSQWSADNDQDNVGALNGKVHSYPVNTKAAAELAAYLYKYGMTDFQRPAFYEIDNEPHWAYWGEPRFWDLHTDVKDLFVEMEIPTLVGGACYSVSNFYKKEFGSLDQIKTFIEGTQNKLDFYSFHTYDYMRWNDTDEAFEGAINSGMALDAVFDAYSAYTYNTYGKEWNYVCSEHGGYMTNIDKREEVLEMLGKKYFPELRPDLEGLDISDLNYLSNWDWDNLDKWKDIDAATKHQLFLYTMEKRTIDNFLMVNSAIANSFTFMDNPHVVLKSVPFILSETSGWSATYYSSLLVRENFEKNNPSFHEARLIDFYKFFKDVRGRRIRSFCDDVDIQHTAFVDDNKLILLFRNQSTMDADVSLNIGEIKGNRIASIMVRRVGHMADGSLRPEFSEVHEDNTLGSVEVKGQASVAVFVEYENDIQERRAIDEVSIYSKESTGIQFKGSKTFDIAVEDKALLEGGQLRVGISLDPTKNSLKEVRIYWNDKLLDTPVEEAADLYTGDDYYVTFKKVRLNADDILEHNTVKVEFPDNRSGGVGGVTLRAFFGDGTTDDDDDEETTDPDEDGDGDNNPPTEEGGDGDVNEKPGNGDSDDTDTSIGCDAGSSKRLRVYPNPTTNILSVESDLSDAIALYDLNGTRVIYHIPTSNRAEISVSHLSRGVYILRCGVYSEKVVIK